MQEPYRVVDVDKAIDPKVTPDLEGPLVDEHMGSKEKFWYRDREGARWLFKHPRENTGEHWAEKIAAEVIVRLEVLHCDVELAIFDGIHGTVSKSFADESQGQELVHGNQALAETVSEYGTEEKRFRQSDHTLENICLALERWTDDAEESKRQFAEYVVLDAVIGNTDRHHENWGILRTRTGGGWTRTLAPTFDHASSLGRELSDEKRNQWLTEKSIDGYIGGGHGGIYWSNSDKRAPSPLELVRLAARSEPGLFRPAISRLEELDDDSLRELVNRVPDDWMSSAAREFAIKLMRYNIETMREMM